MSGFGAKLRREREDRGFTLDQVAEATRINPRYLMALEADDLAKLPGTVFNKGYVRAVAKFVGADPEPLIRDYVLEEESQEQAGRISRPDVMDGLAKVAERNRPQYEARSADSWNPRRVGILALVAVGLVVAGWAFIRFTGSGEDSAAVAPVAPVQPPPTETAQEPRARATEPARTEQVARPPSPEPTATPTARREPTVENTRPEPAATTPESRRTGSVPAPTAGDETRAEAAPVTTDREPEPATRSPEAVAPTKPVEEPAAVESGISITEFGVGTGVANRRLVGESDRFEPGTRVWFWTRVMGGKSGERIHHVWLHEGNEITSTDLRLGGSHWRTQSRKTLSGSSLGSWAVEARDANGRVVARSEFVCVPTVSD